MKVLQNFPMPKGNMIRFLVSKQVKRDGYGVVPPLMEEITLKNRK